MKVVIICPEHGEFKQTPSSHLSGSGCVKCHGVVLIDGAHCASYIEAYYYLTLKKKNIVFEHNKRYPSSIKGDNISGRRFDFYIPSKNEYIEITSRSLSRLIKNNFLKWGNYLKNIKTKKQYVEKELNANFKFIQIDINYKMKKIIKNNMKQRTQSTSLNKNKSWIF